MQQRFTDKPVDLLYITNLPEADLAQIGIVVAVMLFVCITVISVLLSKIKINQALKLGED